MTSTVWGRESVVWVEVLDDYVRVNLGVVREFVFRLEDLDDFRTSQIARCKRFIEVLLWER